MNTLVCGNLPDDIMARITARHETMGHPHDWPLDRDDLLAAVTDKHGLLCMITDTIDAQLLDGAPQLKMIARALTSHRQGQAWVMRRRTQEEMDQLVEAAGFEKIDQRIDEFGIFTVSLAKKK